MRTITAFVFVGVLALAACSTATTPSLSASPTPSPLVGATPSPSVEPTPGPTVVATVEPTPSPAILTIDPAKGERMLLTGVRQDLQAACAPIGMGMPGSAIAGVKCTPKSGVVGHVTLYLFGTQQDLLDAYMARLAGHKVQFRSGDGICLVGKASESAYVPGDGQMLVPERNACYVDASGKAHYVATLPPFVLAEVDGKVGDSAAVRSWAWGDNQDTPGNPTVWRSNAP